MTCAVCGTEFAEALAQCPSCGTASTGLPRVAAAALQTVGTTEAVTQGVTDAETAPAVAATRWDDEGPLRVGQAFGPRYHVLKLIGTGGMGAVYQVWDAELSVAVALKVIRIDRHRRQATVQEESRLKHELLLARQVTHKNVVRIHDLGEIDGIKYIAMPFIQGDNLATVIRRGKIPIPRALSIARQIASGLAAAHEAHVIHRDLKPANVMIHESADGIHVQITDFGISVSPDDVDSTAIAGTPEYMAPEQGSGLPVDARADVYAFGLILYELLTGPRATMPTGDRFTAMSRRFQEGMPPLRSLDGSIPEPLEQLVARCLDVEPSARFPTARELCAAVAGLDDNGELIPRKWFLTRRRVAAIATLVVALLAGTYVVTRNAVQPRTQHDPVSVIIADFANRTNDPLFERTLEPMVKLALESAGFISAYDRSVIGRTLGVRPPDMLDERAALEIAVKQGLGVVVSGTITRQGERFDLSMQAVQAVTGNAIASVSDTARNKEQVLAVATSLASAVREALGDDTPESDRRFALETLSATSLEVVRDYAAAAQAMSNSRFEEAFGHFSRAAQRDPTFGLAYAGMATSSRNLDKQQDAERYIKQAVTHLDGMTERERYRTRGLFYMITGDPEQCVKEFGELVTRYAADTSARNNLAVCLTLLRDLPRALAEMQQVVKILPHRALYRENLALYAAYSGDFETAENEARTIDEPDEFGLLAVAFAQLGQGQVAEALQTYQTIGQMGTLGASYRASGFGDVALYQGRFADAARMFADGAAADLASKDTDRAANKFAALAHAEILRYRSGPAILAAERAMASSNAVKIRFMSARVFIEAGELDRARTLSTGLASELQVEARAYAKIIDGELALKGGDTRNAIRLFTEANNLRNMWIGHFDLGRAFLEAKDFTQADSEFDRCIARRGEALALFLDEEPSFALFPPVYYYQGRAREALGARADESYRSYLNIRGESTEDAFVAEIRRVRR